MAGDMTKCSKMYDSVISGKIDEKYLGDIFEKCWELFANLCKTACSGSGDGKNEELLVMMSLLQRLLNKDMSYSATFTEELFPRKVLTLMESGNRYVMWSISGVLSSFIVKFPSSRMADGLLDDIIAALVNGKDKTFLLACDVVMKVLRCLREQHPGKDQDSADSADICKQLLLDKLGQSILRIYKRQSDFEDGTTRAFFQLLFQILKTLKARSPRRDGDGEIGDAVLLCNEKVLVPWICGNVSAIDGSLLVPAFSALLSSFDLDAATASAAKVSSSLYEVSQALVTAARDSEWLKSISCSEVHKEAVVRELSLLVLRSGRLICDSNKELPTDEGIAVLNAVTVVLSWAADWFHAELNSDLVFRLFAEQDDAMVSAMLSLLVINISFVPSEGCQLTAVKLSPHFVFFSFLKTVSFDPDLLLDFIISSESSEFILYFLKYMKLALQDWPKFRKDVGEAGGEQGCDQVMTVVIRLRLAIERLENVKIFPFSAAPILRLMILCEENYENVS